MEYIKRVCVENASWPETYIKRRMKESAEAAVESHNAQVATTMYYVTEQCIKLFWGHAQQEY